MSGGGASMDRAAVTARLLRARIAPGGRWLEVSGTSMGRTIEEPARVLLAAAPAPRRGEVWAFVSREGDVVAHRFVRRLPDGSLRFRGDGNPGHDAPVRPEALVGRVVRAEDRRGERRVRRRRLWAWMEIVRFGLRRRVAVSARSGPRRRPR